MKLSDLAEGVTIGQNYQLEEILGRGGFGDVWKARRLAEGQVVALKFFRDRDRSRHIVRREADIAKDFDHDNLVRVFWVGVIEGLFCMEMEYVPGETLSRKLSGIRGDRLLTFQDVSNWMEQVAEGLAYLHSRENAISHGDIKLDNLILTPEGNIKITDYGHSRSEEGMQFASSDIGGTWLYIPPEQIDVELGISRCEGDIYSFGVTFYRIITGRFPRKTAAEVHNLTPFPRPCELNSAIPAVIDDIICRCLMKRPEDRFSNGAELLRGIRKFIENQADPVLVEVPNGGFEPGHSSDSPYNLIEEAESLEKCGKYLEALHRLNKALASVSTNPLILRDYARLCLKVGRFKVARETYEQLLGWMEAHGIPVSERRDDTEQLGDLQIEEKDYEAAVETFSILYEQLADDIWLKMKYGISLGLAGQLRESISVLEEVHRERPTSALICAKIGFAYLELKEKKQAEQFFNEALMFDESEPTALYHMAILRAIDGRQDRALRYYQRLCGIEGQEEKAKGLAHMLGLH